MSSAEFSDNADLGLSSPTEGTAPPSPLEELVDVPEAKTFSSCGTQWLIGDTGDALPLQDHTYSCVPPWNPQPVLSSMQPLTSTPKKSPASPILLLKEPSFDEDNFADVTFSDDDNESLFQISFEDLEETIERDVDQSIGDDESFENMCSVPKYIVCGQTPQIIQPLFCMWR